MLNFRLCVVAMGSDVNLENSAVQKIAKKFVYQNCNRIFAASWKLKEKIEKEHGIPVTVTPSSTDTSFFKPLNLKSSLRQKWNIEPEKNVILAVCRLDKNKAVDILINALKSLNQKDVTLLIAGEGPERKSLEALATKLGVRSNVVFLGFRSRAELLELYNLADIFTISSYAEGLPRVLIEAMSCGCIPIATNVGSIDAVVVNGVNGFVVPTGNSQVFSEKIRQLFSFSEEKKRQMQNLARQAVLERFDSEKILKDIVESVNAL
jgi:glycosyltransferase involved in cell wall biosynthesis